MSAQPLFQRPGLVLSLIVTVGMVATIGAAWGFQLIGGYLPCELCLWQRQPYYWGITVGLAAVLASGLQAPTWVIRLLLAIVLLLMIAGAATGVYHAGVEWKFWEGPAACSGNNTGVTTDASQLLNDLNALKGPSCGDARWRFLGLSFAGWNVVLSLILAGIAYAGLRRKPDGAQ
jgi:disulfide bond formation protein DsbB